MRGVVIFSSNSWKDPFKKVGPIYFQCAHSIQRKLIMQQQHLLPEKKRKKIWISCSRTEGLLRFNWPFSQQAILTCQTRVLLIHLLIAARHRSNCWNAAFSDINVISSTCALPAMTCGNVLRERKVLSRSDKIRWRFSCCQNVKQESLRLL